MKDELLKKHLWDYIYDEDILPARIYSPSEKLPDNVPKRMLFIAGRSIF